MTTSKNAGAEIINWLVAEAPRCGSPSGLLDGYCNCLRDAGVPVDRATLGAPLLHPIAQSSYVFWNVEKGASQRWFQWTPDALQTMRASPIFPIYTEGRTSQLMLADEASRSQFPIGADLWAEGYAQYNTLALRFSDGSFKVLTVATRKEGGFGDSLAIVEDTLAALSLVFEGFVARNTAKTLMETYVGKRAGLRVLDGEIARGDGSHIKAVIWFSDLRDFTRLSQAMDETQLLSILNGYFALVTNAIEENQGEVLKFIGDAMLAIFPHEGEVDRAVARAESAAFEALDSHRKSEVSAISFGIGLHPGEVFYGNIGGGTRLDFTVIGEAVNIASRIAGLAGKLNQKLLVSEVLAGHSKRDWKSAGRHELKGVAEPMQVFVPAG